jgi:hypothetical protein
MIRERGVLLLKKGKKKKWSTEHCLSRLSAQEERAVLLLKGLERGC